uniref:Clp1 P-loop domain-containing protein n=1 Tax=Aureoumbra lagunensis TaxID=44058 RepID=A0A7S3JWE4_9STRA
MGDLEEFAKSHSTPSLRNEQWGLERIDENTLLVEVRRGCWRLIIRKKAIVEIIKGRCEIDGSLLDKKGQKIHIEESALLAPVIRARSKRAIVRIEGGDFIRTRSIAEAGSAFGLAICNISKAWRRVMRLALSHQVTLICGPKAVGKSTLCKLIANAFGDVWILDSDLGQPLLGPPGFVSIRRHTSKSFALRIFIGDVTPRDAPQVYLAAIERLITYWCMQQDLPLLINTCGWVRGLGAELLNSIIRVSRPQLCVAIGDCLPLGVRNIISLKPYKRPDYLRAQASAPQRRTLALARYFLASTPNIVRVTNGALADPNFAVGQAIAALPRFKASIHKLRLGLVGAAAQQEISFSDAIASLPGALVGLASTIDLTETLDETHLLLPSEIATVLPCRGLALVVALDLTNNSLLLTLPDPHLLSDCDILLRGTLHASIHLIYSGPQAPAFPFLAANALASDPMRSRSNLQRRRNGAGRNDIYDDNRNSERKRKK